MEEKIKQILLLLMTERYLNPRDVCRVSQTCRSLYETFRGRFQMARAYYGKWNPRRALLEACLANDPQLVEIFVRPSNVKYVQHCVRNYGVFHVLMTKSGCDERMKHNVAFYFKLLQNRQINEVPWEHAESILSYCCIYNIHEIVKMSIRNLYSYGLEKLALKLQAIAFWNGSVECYQLLDIALTRDQKEGHTYTHACNKIRIRDFDKLVYSPFYSYSEWWLTAVLCNSFAGYLEFLGDFLREKAPNVWYYPEFSFCDEPDIVLDWYEIIPTDEEKTLFKRAMRDAGANKLIMKELETRRYPRRTCCNCHIL